MGIFRFLGKLFAPPLVEAVDETKPKLPEVVEINGEHKRPASKA